MPSNFTIPGLVFLLTLVFGFLLSRSGKPYNGILFNLHKLVALGMVIYSGWQFYQWLKGANAPREQTVLLVAAALCVIALFASGGQLSAGKLDYALMLTTHRIAPMVLIIALVLVAIFLQKTGNLNFPQ